MGSSDKKKKTTMAKLARESRLRERRLSKQAKRDARRQAPSDQLDLANGPPKAGTAQSASLDPGPATVHSPARYDREDAREKAASGPARQEPTIGPARVSGDEPADGDISDPNDHPASDPGPADAAVRTSARAEREPADPRGKQVALLRLRDSSDEELAVFEHKLRDAALQAGATEREMRDAQRNHLGHGA